MKSDNVKKGMQQAPHRSLFNALGFTKEEMDKPLVGKFSTNSPGAARTAAVALSANAMFLLAASMCSLAPVSYTHLDVYKRQVLIMLFLRQGIPYCGSCKPRSYSFRRPL